MLNIWLNHAVHEFSIFFWRNWRNWRTLLIVFFMTFFLYDFSFPQGPEARGAAVGQSSAAGASIEKKKQRKRPGLRAARRACRSASPRRLRKCRFLFARSLFNRPHPHGLNHAHKRAWLLPIPHGSFTLQRNGGGIVSVRRHSQ